MREVAAALLVECDCELGEGVQWDAGTARLWWTDIHGRRLLSCDAAGQGVEERRLSERLGSFAFDPDGNLLAAFESGLFRWDLTRDRLDRLTDFEPGVPGTRLNDGRCDRQGRFLTGGVQQVPGGPPSTLIRYTGRVEVLRSGVRCTNGLAFAPDGRTMYFADSPTGQIRAFALDPLSGGMSGERVIHDGGPGYPDGACVDAAGNIWSARWDGSCVLCLSPEGAVLARVAVPVPQVSCACFGGPDLGTLYITTAREGYDAARRAAHPLAGALFACRPGGVGLPETRYAERLF